MVLYANDSPLKCWKHWGKVMTIAALILGILGGILALGVGSCVAAVGGLAEAFGGGGELAVRGFFNFAAGIIGIIGGGLASTRPEISTITFVAATVVGVIAVGVLFVLPAIFFIVGALLAWFGRKEVA